MGKSLLDRIESEALGGHVVKALRLCITLGGRSASVELREWAARELRGYGRDDELLDYRRIGAPLCVDGFTRDAMFTGRTISVLELPDFAQADLSEELELRYSIPELQEMARAAEQKGESVRLSPPGAADLLLYMNGSGDYNVRLDNVRLERLYWQVAPTTIKGVVERVCTDIIELLGEMRAGMHRGHDLPSADLAAQAFSVVVKGTPGRVRPSRPAGNRRVAGTDARHESQSSATYRHPRPAAARRHTRIHNPGRSAGDRSFRLRQRTPTRPLHSRHRNPVRLRALG